MRHWRIWLYLLAMAAILITCAVVSMPNNNLLPNSPTKMAVASETKPVGDTGATDAAPTHAAAIQPTNTLEAEPAEPPVETEAAVVESVDQCVLCHTDKVQLIDTAATEEAVVEESEGAG